MDRIYFIIRQENNKPDTREILIAYKYLYNAKLAYHRLISKIKEDYKGDTETIVYVEDKTEVLHVDIDNSISYQYFIQFEENRYLRESGNILWFCTKNDVITFGEGQFHPTLKHLFKHNKNIAQLQQYIDRAKEDSRVHIAEYGNRENGTGYRCKVARISVETSFCYEYKIQAIELR